MAPKQCANVMKRPDIALCEQPLAQVLGQAATG
jgi:hypothetical protein